MKNLSRSLAAISIGAVLAIGMVAPAGAAKDKAYASKIRLSDKFPAFHGKVKSDADVCIDNRKIRLFRDRKGVNHDKVIGKTRTDSMGKWQIIKIEKSGAYYAKVNKGGSASLNITCKSAVSKVVVID